ncbi:MAG: hypothetical protein KME52_28390 [Desmonostoc geniculatum HA4340-LM1]|jgi:hypothetical protein|nr:hypothetical protein [Desmonostoc geniculatum HA4340-LM1]
MPVFIDRNLNIYEKNPVVTLPTIQNTSIVSDTEFTEYLKKLIVDCIGIYFPELFYDYLVIFTYDELTSDFHPVRSALKAFGYDIKPANEDDLLNIIGEIQDTVNELIDFSQPTRKVTKQFKQLIEEGYFENHLAELNVESECLKLEKDRSTDTFTVTVKPPKIIIPFVFFYGFADLFRTGGKDWQYLLLNASLVQQRCLKFRSPHGRETPLTEYNYVEGVLYEFSHPLREVMYRFPPVSKGLDAQTSIFEVETRKINVNTWLIAKTLGFNSLNEIKENFSQFLDKMPEKALQYNATDIFATWDLNLKQQEFYNIILQTFGIESIDISDTTGSNVSKFLVECIKKEFGVSGIKEVEKLIKEIIGLGNLSNLEETPLNDYGCQPFLTVGGLLYSRMAKIKYLKGYLSDCDLKSCYASFMSMMNVYLGEPITLTCKYDKYKITLNDALELIENQKTPHDGWFIRVSGKLNKAINTLVMSDLKFKPKNIKQQNLYEVSDNRKSIEVFNAYKTSKRQAQSTILTKEIKFGLITKSTIEALKKLPNDWYEEYLNLKCDVVCFFPGDLIADNLSDYCKIRDNLPEQDRIERIDIKNGAKGIDSQRYKNNACLAFPIHKYWLELKTNRNKFKKAKNPIQEVFKLFQNSGYGVLACLYLAMNNLMASNQITAGARSGAWLMTNAINGFGSITDGTGYSWGHIPIGKRFHEILTSNPSYLEHFDESIKSGINITKDFNYQGWIDENLKKHMAKFYGVDADSDYNLNQFDYELKTEIFLTKEGKEWLENYTDNAEELKYELGTGWNKYLSKHGYMVETPLFTKFYNNNAGNYCKGIDSGDYLIEGTEYDLVNNEPFVKARSFQGKDNNLIDWYCKAIGERYTEPIIYSEVKLIKFGDGNKIAISLLESGSEEIAHPMGFDTVAYKMMKLITRSQFLFQTELQLRNFETNEETLANLSKELGLNQKQFWNNLTNEDIKQYGVELRKNVDYFNYSKHHPVGIGFELLALAPSIKGDINKIRQKIVELIDKGCRDFAPALNLFRNIKYGIPLKNLFAAVIVAKKNAEDDLRTLLENSADEPTILSVTSDNIKRLRELMNNSE